MLFIVFFGINSRITSLCILLFIYLLEVITEFHDHILVKWSSIALNPRLTGHWCPRLASPVPPPSLGLSNPPPPEPLLLHSSHLGTGINQGINAPWTALMCLTCLIRRFNRRAFLPRVILSAV